VLALFITAVICVSCLFLMGSARSFFTGKNAFRSGIEMTFVGSGVALITYAVGYAFRTAERRLMGYWPVIQPRPSATSTTQQEAARKAASRALEERPEAE
jgi:VIT family